MNLATLCYEIKYRLRVLMPRSPLSDGRWAVRIVHEECSPGRHKDTPGLSRRRLLFNTKKVTQSHLMHYWPAGQAPGTMPTTESNMYAVVITPRWGKPVELYRVMSSIQFFLNGNVYSFDRDTLHTDISTAYEDLNACGNALRSRLLGTVRTFSDHVQNYESRHVVL